jgi:hypothetical protein
LSDSFRPFVWYWAGPLRIEKRGDREKGSGVNGTVMCNLVSVAALRRRQTI